MLQAKLLESCVQISGAAVHLGIDWLLQSTLLIALGLLAAKVFRTKGVAVQSAIYRMTLGAVLACPIVSLLLGAAGMRGLELHLAADAPAASYPTGEMNHEAVAGDDEAVLGGRQTSLPDRIGSSVTQTITRSPLERQPRTLEANPRHVPILRTVAVIHWSALLHTLLAAAWFLGSSALAIRLFIGWRLARQLCRSACPADSHTVAGCRALAARMGIRAPQVLRSGFAASPALVGILRPVVLLPEEENLQANDQEVLVHELAHLARGDQVWSLLGRIGTALLFYQPLVWLLVRRMVLAAEEVCDDHVIDLGFDRPAYAQRLVDVAERYQPVEAFAVGMVSLRFRVSRRVVRILDSSRQLSTRISRRAEIFIVAATLIAAVLAGALSVGNRAAAAPSTQEDQHAAASGASQADDSIDTTYMREKASMMLVMRPAAAFARPELTALAKLLEQPFSVLPKGARLTDFRQITVIGPEAYLPLRLREVVTFQCTQPIAAKDFIREWEKYTVKDCNGKKMYVGSSSGFVALQYDDRTVISAASEQAMGAYLAGKPGVLPKWLPAKAWESFRGDHFVIAGDTAIMWRDMRWLAEHSPKIVCATLSPILSLCEDTTWLAGGARLNNGLAVHALAVAKDADSSAKVQAITEALKTLVQIAVKSARSQAEANQKSGLFMPRELWVDSISPLPPIRLASSSVADGPQPRSGFSVTIWIASE